MIELNDLAKPPRRSAGYSPLRDAHSIRRTSTIDVAWPEGFGKSMRLSGNARDLFTITLDKPPEVRAEAAFDAGLSVDRTIDIPSMLSHFEK